VDMEKNSVHFMENCMIGYITPWFPCDRGVKEETSKAGKFAPQRGRILLRPAGMEDRSKKRRRLGTNRKGGVAVSPRGVKDQV